MPKRLIRLEGDPLFNLWSYARPGSSRRDRLSPEETEQITLTARRTPEVMVKVLTRGGQDLKAIRRHLSYLNRGGDLDIESDDGERLKGEGVESDLVSEWDLELEEDRRRSKLGPREDRAPPKMVHKLLFSMPPGTAPQKVLDAVKNFAREEFALQHRYAMVLHSDEPHPHVHMLVKAVSEQGQRLNIRKAMLRQWRSEFARHLRALGVPANATQRYVRGQTSPRKSDGIYRASLRGDSTHMRERAEAVARDPSQGNGRVEPGKAKLVETRNNVRRAWWTVSEILNRDKQPDLAAEVTRFAEQMPPAMTEREWMAGKLVERAPPPRIPEGPSR
jgi:predicted transcriptional regulator